MTNISWLRSEVHIGKRIQVIANLILFVFFFLYCLRQSDLSRHFFLFDYIFALPALTILLRHGRICKNINFSAIIFNHLDAIKFASTVLLFLASSILLYNQNYLLQFFKLSLLLALFLSYFPSVRPLILVSSWGIFCGVICVALFVATGVIENECATYPNWSKCAIGFNNFNIPGIFLFTSALGFFVAHRRYELILTLTVIFSFAFHFDAFSRTSLLGSLVIFSFFIAGEFDRRSGCDFSLRKALYNQSQYLIAICALSVILIFVFNLNEGFIEAFSYFDDLSSGRISKIFSLGVKFIESGSVIFIPMQDFLLLELFVIFGPLPIFLILFPHWRRLNGPQAVKLDNHYDLYLGASAVLAVGFLEGFLLKITPATFILTAWFLCVYRSRCGSE